MNVAPVRLTGPDSWISSTLTSRSGSGTPMGRSRIPWTSAKISVLAPMATAIVVNVVRVKEV